MNNAKAIAVKQAKDLVKNRAVLIQFLIMPVMALILTELVAKGEPELPDLMFVNMFAAVFVGMIVVTATTGIIAEDREHKSLRFLVMAGVRPGQYLGGVGVVVLGASAIVSVMFGLMGGFTVVEFGKFMVLMLVSSVASMTLGGLIGILSSNQQAATAVAMPVAMVVGFAPMIAMFNEAVKTVFAPLYTMQASLALGDLSAGVGKPLLIMAANVVVLVVAFGIAYRKTGLRN